MSDNPAFDPGQGEPEAIPRYRKTSENNINNAENNNSQCLEVPGDLSAKCGTQSPAVSSDDLDPWNIVVTDLKDDGPKWSELDRTNKIKRVLINIAKFIALFGLLYLFICSLDFLASAFKLIGGKAAGQVFRQNEQLRNPVVGLMIGVLVTVLVQSSSTSTSIVVTMVASNLIDVPTAIPIVMGANIGTSVTNTLVSLAQSGDRNEFRRAFAGATVHDMFNWLAVIVFLPLEVATGYLRWITGLLVNAIEWPSDKEANREFLTLLTKPFTKLIVQLDSKVIAGIAVNDEKFMNKSLIKHWCKTSVKVVNESFIINGTEEFRLVNETTYEEKCKFALNFELGDAYIGLILLFVSLVLLCVCLIFMVKILHSMMKGKIANVIKKTVNADFPFPFGFLTGYLALLVGCVFTILVQSSSVFTSALTPLVGMGVISLERMYPLTLGANLGTTTTGLLASLAATGSQLKHSVQIALCHLFFNLSGIIVFYPIPFMRWPIKFARFLGDTTAKYRWFSVLYLIVLFFILPASVFLLSLGGYYVMMSIGIPLLILFTVVAIINVMQRKSPQFLPAVLRSWDFLPLWCHSFKPWDRVIVRMQESCAGCCPCIKKNSVSTSAMYNSGYDSRTNINNDEGGSTLTVDMSSYPKTQEEKRKGVNVTSAV